MPPAHKGGFRLIVSHYIYNMLALEGATHTIIVTFTYRPARSDANKSHYDSRTTGAHAATRPPTKRARGVWWACGSLMDAYLYSGGSSCSIA